MINPNDFMNFVHKGDNQSSFSNNNSVYETESGTFEIFMSGASPSMLELTDKFSDRLAEECKERGLSLRIQKQNQHQTLYIIADEAYILENDGVVASWSPINIHFS